MRKILETAIAWAVLILTGCVCVAAGIGISWLIWHCFDLAWSLKTGCGFVLAYFVLLSMIRFGTRKEIEKND